MVHGTCLDSFNCSIHSTTVEVFKWENIMTPDQRTRIIEKILEDHDDETLFELLKLDLFDIFNAALLSKSDDELLEIIL